MLAAHAAAGLLAAALVVLTDRLLAAALRPRRCRLLLTAVLPVEPSTATAGPRAVAPIVTGRLAEFVVRAPRRGPPPVEPAPVATPESINMNTGANTGQTR